MQDDSSTFIASSQVDGGHSADALTIQDDVLRCYTVPVQHTHTHVSFVYKVILHFGGKVAQANNCMLVKHESGFQTPDNDDTLNTFFQFLFLTYLLATQWFWKVHIITHYLNTNQS